MQSKLESLLETILNVLSGVAVSYVLGYYLYPLFNITITPSQNISIVATFTVASIIRSYIWRRFFNRRFINKCKDK